MQERHADRKQYFDEQAETTLKYVIPFIREKMEVTASINVLEPGCAEAGNLKPFLDMGCECVGVDFDKPRVEIGKEFYIKSVKI